MELFTLSWIYSTAKGNQSDKNRNAKYENKPHVHSEKKTVWENQSDRNRNAKHERK